MKRLLPVLGILIAAGLTLASGFIHGRMSNRWLGASKVAQPAVESLKNLPDNFGFWQGQPLEEMPAATVNTLECMGYSVRAYVNQDTGETVRVAILLGPAGPISVHTPEICYSSRNHKLHEKRQPVRVSENFDDEFWALTFRSTDLDAGLLRVYYGWTTGGTWAAVDNPRVSFAGYPYLYKIQLSSNLLGESDSAAADTKKSDPCARFLRDFLPVARRFLVEPSSD